jgi:ketosteroid isomerase-like protein
MSSQQPAAEAEIRQRIDQLVDAIRAMDLERLKEIYAPDIVTFDVQGPLQRVGAEAKLGNWAEAFAALQPPLGYEFRDLAIILGGDLAVAHGFGRLSGTLKNGTRSGGSWVRFTACLRKVGGKWLIVHDHASLPFDVQSGRALSNLEP